jgi:TRAP-type mannitol/chloroaromatic compound transport system permease small subunit
MCLPLIFMGGDDAIYSWQIWEHSNSTWAPPLYPIRTIIPVAAILLFLQGLSNISGEIAIIVNGRAKEESEHAGN